MSSLHVRAHPQAYWYVLWSAMLLIAAGNVLVPRPILSANACLICSALLAMLAGLEIWPRIRQKEGALCAVLLLAFCTAQFLQSVRLAIPGSSPNRATDFSAYYLAGKTISEKPAQSLYQLPRFADGRLDVSAPVPVSSPWHDAAIRYHMPFAYPYIYPPFFATLLRPFVHLSFDSAFIAWNIVSVLLSMGAVLLALSLGGVRLNGRLALMLGVGLFSYFPLLNNLFFGQGGGVILFLLSAGVWLLSRSRTGLSALCFAAATMIKLTPALAVPVLIFHRRWKWLMAYVAWMITLLAISIGQAGWMAHQQFWREVLPSISNGAPICQNSSIVAFVQELFLGRVPLGKSASATLPPYAGAVSRLVALLVYYLMLARFYLRRREGNIVRDLVIMVLLGLAVSPISWWHHYTLALLPFVYLWCRMPNRGRSTLLLLFVAVATNIVGLIQCSGINPVVRLVLAAVVPGLTIAVAYLALAARPELSTGVFDPEVATAEVAYSAS